MHVGICKITLNIPENQSLKGKRRIIQSFCSALKKNFNVAVAEVEAQDRWQIAVIGMVCLSDDSKYLQQYLSEIMQYVRDYTGEFVLLNDQVEIIKGI